MLKYSFLTRWDEATYFPAPFVCVFAKCKIYLEALTCLQVVFMPRTLLKYGINTYCSMREDGKQGFINPH